MQVESELIPLKDEARSKKIEIPTKNLKKTYSVDEFDYPKVEDKNKKNEGQLDDDD
jgi:hypothetical protein